VEIAREIYFKIPPNLPLPSGSETALGRRLKGGVINSPFLKACLPVGRGDGGGFSLFENDVVVMEKYIENNPNGL